MTLTLTLRDTAPAVADASALRPDALAGLGRTGWAAVTVKGIDRCYRLDELFAISGDDPARLVITHADARLERLGAGMTGGELIIQGTAGAWLGRGLRGGVVRLEGSCGSHAGSGMRGGALYIAGDAGDDLAGPAPGERFGLQGGLIHVRGGVGDRAVARLRRGTVVIDGDAGAGAAQHLIAGTLVVGGAVGPGLGLGMRRGTIVLQQPVELPATFHDSGPRTLAFLALLRASLAPLQSPAARFGDRLRRFLGDRANAGLGEILVVEDRC